MPPNHKKDFPRIFGIIEVNESLKSQCTLFKNFEMNLADPDIRNIWEGRETEFQKLPKEAWDSFKEKIKPYLGSRHTDRGYEQLIATLNEAYTYNYLVLVGCDRVQFIPESQSQPSPDLQGWLEDQTILCEVKTIQASDNEIQERKKRIRVSTADQKQTLPEEFFNKLEKTINKARDQLDSFNSEAKTKIVFLYLNFDDSWGKFKNEYFAQMNIYFSNNPPCGIEVVLHNPKTIFHGKFSANNVTVINERYA